MEFPLLHLNLIRKPAGTAVRKVKYEIFGAVRIQKEGGTGWKRNIPVKSRQARLDVARLRHDHMSGNARHPHVAIPYPVE